jgi:hypothetical protein
MLNAFFSFTTLTHYYRRYHQPDTRLAHMLKKKKDHRTTKQPPRGGD